MVVTRLLAPAMLAVSLALAQPVAAADPAPGEGMRTIATKHAFGALWNKLKETVKANDDCAGLGR